MKDKYTGDLCFIRTQNLKRNAADCDLCDVGIDSATCSVRDNCESNTYYKLAEEQPLEVSKISVKLTGLNQDYEVVEEVIEIPDTGESVTAKESFFDRGARYDFKKEDPEKIKAEPLSEYEHNLERWKLLDDWHHPKYTAEYKKLEKWIKANKPEKWETVTIENTKIGDVVRFTTSKNIRRVKYISDNIDLIIVDGQGVDDVQERIGRYEINTYKE